MIKCEQKVNRTFENWFLQIREHIVQTLFEGEFLQFVAILNHSNRIAFVFFRVLCKPTAWTILIKSEQKIEKEVLQFTMLLIIAIEFRGCLLEFTANTRLDQFMANLYSKSGVNLWIYFCFFLYIINFWSDGFYCILQRC